MKANRFAIYRPALAAKLPDRIDFGNRVGEMMTMRNLSIIDLAKGIGVSYEMARRYCTGTGKPNWDRMQLIAKYLEVDVNWLAYGDDHGQKPTEALSIPLFKLSSKEMARDILGEDRLTTPTKADFAVRVDNPMGCDLHKGDIAFVDTQSQPQAGDRCLIKAKTPESFVTYLIRRMRFDSKMQPYFVAATEDYPDLNTETFETVGVVTAVLSMA